jgi:hypothetical protein
MMKFIALLVFSLAPLIADAHRFAPSALDVRALANGEISVVWKTPAQATFVIGSSTNGYPTASMPLLNTPCYMLRWVKLQPLHTYYCNLLSVYT